MQTKYADEIAIIGMACMFQGNESSDLLGKYIR